MGIESEIVYPTERFALPPESGILLYTDGLPDAQAPAGNRLGIEGVRKALYGRYESAQAMLDATVRVVDEFRGPACAQRRPDAGRDPAYAKWCAEGRSRRRVTERPSGPFSLREKVRMKGRGVSTTVRLSTHPHPNPLPEGEGATASFHFPNFTSVT
jgi:hypothetical protein